MGGGRGTGLPPARWWNRGTQVKRPMVSVSPRTLGLLRGGPKGAVALFASCKIREVREGSQGKGRKGEGSWKSHTEARRRRETSRGGKRRDGGEKSEGVVLFFNLTGLRCMGNGQERGGMDATSASRPRRKTGGSEQDGNVPRRCLRGKWIEKRQEAWTIGSVKETNPQGVIRLS